MRSAPVFTGVGVALLTFFDDDGNLMAGATAEHAARLVGRGIGAVLVAGTSGESSALDPEERLALLDKVRDAVPAGSGVPLIVGTGAPSARQAAALTASARDHGADAVLVLSPHGSPDPRPYYDEVAKAAADTPMLAYHFPAASSPGISVEHLCDLPVSGCKDSSGDVTRLLCTLSQFSGSIWVGNPSLVLMAGAMHAAGTTHAAGAIVSLANLDPESCLAARAGDADAQQRLAELHVATSHRFPADLKAFVARRWGTPAGVRIL